MPITSTRVQTRIILTCDQCGVSATFTGEEPVPTPGWVRLRDPFVADCSERTLFVFDSKAHAVDWLRSRVNAMLGS